MFPSDTIGAVGAQIPGQTHTLSLHGESMRINPPDVPSVITALDKLMEAVEVETEDVPF